MRRTVCMMLSLAICLSLIAGAAQAAGTPEISISSGTVNAGESVVLEVSIKNNPGIAATTVYLYYDTDTFTVNPSKDILAAGEFAASGSVIGNTIKLAKENGRYNGQSGKDGVLALWFNGSGINTEGDGELLTVQLHVKENAVNGNYTVQVDVAGNETFTETSDTLTPKTKNGTVTVTGGTTEDKPEKEDEKIDKNEKEPLKEVPPEFIDISGNWAEEYIQQAAELGLIEGYLGKYRPNDTMTRAEFVTILWRAMGEPQPLQAAGFTDLTQDWYLDAVAWAEENAVVNGVGEEKFAPNGTVTREQMATIFHRMAGTPVGAESMFMKIYDSQYPDSSSIGSWARGALYWSVYNGIYCGTASEEIGGHLYPKLPANRAQIAVMIVRFLDMKKKGKNDYEKNKIHCTASCYEPAIVYGSFCCGNGGERSQSHGNAQNGGSFGFL